MDLLKNKENVLSTNKMVKIAVFGAISGILMLFKFPLPIAPAFMTVDLSDVATLVSGFVLGPVSGVITVIIKNLLNLLLQGTQTFYVGELSNTIIGSVFVLVSSIIYHRDKTKITAIIGLLLGVLFMTMTATLSNYFVIFPLYARVMGIELESFVNMMPPNNYVNSFMDLILLAVIPFNIVKGFINGLVTILIYKNISKLIKSLWLENKWD